MLSIIGVILKVIGILLLCIIGLMLVLLLTMLFVPIRYRVDGHYHEEYSLQIKITWILHMISCQFHVRTNESFAFRIKLFGITLWNSQKKTTKKKKQKAKRKKKGINSIGQSSSCSTEQQSVSSSETSQVNQTETEFKTVNQEKQNQKAIESQNEIKKEKMSFISKCKLAIQKGLSFIHNIKYSFLHFCDKIKDVKNMLTKYCDLLKSQEFKKAWKQCRKQLHRMFINIKPTKFDVNIYFGRENDPESVGKALEIWGDSYVFHKGHVQLLSEFDQDICEGDMIIKGHITLFVYLRIVFLFLFDKNFKYIKDCIVQEDS